MAAEIRTLRRKFMVDFADGLADWLAAAAVQSMYFSPRPPACGSRIVHVQAQHAAGELGALFAFEALALDSGFQRLCTARAAGTRTTPSSSATMTSPGVTSMPAHTMGMFTEPSVALMVPLLLIALLQTGSSSLSRSSRRARQRQ